MSEQKGEIFAFCFNVWDSKCDSCRNYYRSHGCGNHETLIWSPLGYPEFMKMLKTNAAFQKQFSEWHSFKILMGEGLHSHPEYKKYKDGVKKATETIDFDLPILKELSTLYI